MKRRDFLAAAGLVALGSTRLARAAAARPRDGQSRDGQPRDVPLARQSPDGNATPADSLGSPPAPNAADGAAGTPSSASNVPMDPSNYKAVGRPPKPGTRPLLSADQRDALEHRIKCQCPCTLDVYTCRTTDFSCGVSPAMHQDVQQLVAGGYSGDEILAAFRQTYGDRVLMSPPKVGFNLAGYFAPMAVLGTGTVVVGSLMRRWSTRAVAVAATNAGRASAQPAPLSAARA
ncbi:MAG TPA: cytochrome c-type biogenesis protein CcmH, partial [Gemmatirosa sp.]